MIEKLQKPDIDTVIYIWFDTNIKSHNFISAQYWKNNLETVKQMILQAEVYIYKEKNKIQGFIGLNDEYIAGIFVASEAQSHGIGKQLIDFVKGIKRQLNLRVYQKNTRAIQFYQREGFKILNQDVDKNTNEKEYYMVWKQ